MAKVVWLSLTLLCLSACGPQEIILTQPAPLVVEHRMSLDDIKAYFRYQCLRDDPTLYGAALDECVAAKLVEFYLVVDP